MKNPPAFQLYAQDFLADAKVSVMNAHEVGVYVRLLLHCWVEDGLPNDEEDLQDLSKGGDSTLQPWAQTWKKVQRCFYEKDGKLRNKRLDMEREKQIRWREKSSKGGKKAAKNKQDIKGGSRVVQGCRDNTDTLQSSSSSSDNQKDKSLSSVRSRTQKPSAPEIKLILDEHPKRWENITDDDKKLWAATYPGVDVEHTLQEMIAYWDAQPASKRKLNWKRTIVNRLKWLQDNGGTRKGGASGASTYLTWAERDRQRLDETLARQLEKAKRDDEAEAAAEAERAKGRAT